MILCAARGLSVGDQPACLRAIVRGLAVAAAAALASASHAGADERIGIATGFSSGLYYTAGKAICDAVQQRARGLTCTVAESLGSASNILSLDPAKLQFAIVQSDVQFQATQGLNEFALVDAASLRSVLSLHAEAFTVLVRADSPITRFDELRGKRLNLGAFGTGTLLTGDDLLNGLGWSTPDRSLISHADPSTTRDALCKGEIDAAAYLMGHPSPSIAEFSESCPIRLISLTPESVSAIARDKPHYAVIRIAGGLYSGNPEPVTTLGVMATLVTLASVPDDLVFALTKSVFESSPQIRSASPAFGTLQAKSMVRAGLTAPIHPGALRYYHEAGLIDPSDPGVTDGVASRSTSTNPIVHLSEPQNTTPTFTPPKLQPPKLDDLGPAAPPVQPKDRERWETTAPPF